MEGAEFDGGDEALSLEREGEFEVHFCHEERCFAEADV